MTPQRYTNHAEVWLFDIKEKLAPEFLHIEAANALWKYENADLMSSVHTDRAWRNLIESGIRLVPDQEYLGQARVLARLLKHPIYDCLYLAVAIAHEAILITADRRFYNVALRYADDHPDTIKVSWIEDDPPSIPQS
jgi:predicted nucleic acid-binding protein